MPDRVEPLVLRQVRRQVALWSRSAYDNASHLHQFEQFCDWRRFALLPQNGRDHVTLTKRALSRIGKWGESAPACGYSVASTASQPLEYVERGVGQVLNGARRCLGRLCRS